MNPATLESFGIEKRDICQTIAAEKIVRIYLDYDKRISKKIVRDRLGEKKYWLAIYRAAFHATAGLHHGDHDYDFNCRQLFKAI